MNLEHWRDFEHEQNPQDEEAMKKVAGLMPKRVKKRRKIQQDEVIISRFYFYFLHMNTLISRVFFFRMLREKKMGLEDGKNFLIIFSLRMKVLNLT